jgi:hypothetical protein
MTSYILDLTKGKPARRVICAAVALAITAATIQVIISSAGVHEYGMAAARQSPARSTPHDTTPSDSAPEILASIFIARSL